MAGDNTHLGHRTQRDVLGNHQTAACVLASLHRRLLEEKPNPININDQSAWKGTSVTTTLTGKLWERLHLY